MPTNQFVNNMETLNNTIVMWKEIHIVYKNYAKYNIMAYYWQKLVQILFGSFSRGGCQSRGENTQLTAWRAHGDVMSLPDTLFSALLPSFPTRDS